MGATVEADVGEDILSGTAVWVPGPGLGTGGDGWRWENLPGSGLIMGRQWVRGPDLDWAALPGTGHWLGSGALRKCNDA